MGWSYRKSFSSGPFRINFSKSGISTSVGIKGARVTFGPRGTYVNLSAHGISYRHKINSPVVAVPIYEPDTTIAASAHVQQIASAAVEKLTDTDSLNFVRELEQKSKLISYARWFGYVPMFTLLLLLLCFSFESHTSGVQPATDSTLVRVTSPVGVYVRKYPSAKSTVIKSAANGDTFMLYDATNGKWFKVRVDASVGYIRRQFAVIDQVHHNEETHSEVSLANSYLGYQFAGILIFFIWCINHLKRKDRERCTVELQYEMDEHLQQVYKLFKQHFETFAGSTKIWQYLTKQQTYDLKRNAGAGQLINRIPVRGVFRHLPPLPHFVTNISIPCIRLSNLDLYFLPERLLIKRGANFAAVFYKNLHLDGFSSRFIEDESVPRDAQVIDYTWRYVNKHGGPDRRFNDNRQIPICAYSQYTLTSDTGIYEVLTTSKKGAMDAFGGLIGFIGKLQAQLTVN